MQSDFSVSRIVPDILSEIAEIERECFSTPWSAEALSILTVEPNVGFYIACDGRAVGYIGMQTVLDEGQITDIAVIPSYRRRGIARNLLAALIEYARANAINVLFLEVRESNLPALSLYRDTFGFEIVGVRKGFYTRPREDAYNMRLLLSDTASCGDVIPHSS